MSPANSPVGWIVTAGRQLLGLTETEKSVFVLTMWMLSLAKTRLSRLKVSR